MDTLGCACGLIALLLHVITHPRMLRFFTENSARPSWATVAEIALAGFALVGGVVGYHRDWPRWANGRAIVAVATGGLILAVAVAELASHG